MGRWERPLGGFQPFGVFEFIWTTRCYTVGIRGGCSLANVDAGNKYNHGNNTELMMFLLPPSPTGLNTEGIYRVSGNKAEMESMQRQFEQGYLSSSASAVFPTSIC